MNFFKKIADRFENAMVAVTFAEAGEFETARKIQEESRQKKPRSKQRRKTLRPVTAR